MNYLFIHQNFPGQYRHLVHHLAAQGNQVYFITQPNDNAMSGVHKITYPKDQRGPVNCHAYSVEIDRAIHTGASVAEACRALAETGYRPDLVIGHGGWGETLFVKDVFPEIPLLANFEFFYHARGADVGFDPEFAPAREDDGARLKVRNAINRLSFAACDWGHTATAWQRSLFPAAMQSGISLLHEGVDTAQVRPDPNAWLELARDGIRVSREDEIITFAARNLEPYRGFHVFMRALPELLKRRPRAKVLIAGGGGISYGEPLPGGGSYVKLLQAELGSRLDASRVHFLGHLSPKLYLNLLQVSSVHVYLSYPFVLSWSFIEALAAGCLVVGSATAPVLEVLADRQNGLTVDFFSGGQLCDRVEEVLEHADRMQALRDAARATAIRYFDLEGYILPRWTELIGTLAAGRRPPEQPATPGLATAQGLR